MMALMSPKVWFGIAFAALLAIVGLQQVRVSIAKAATAEARAALASDRAAYAQAAQKAEVAARAKEQQWQTSADATTKAKDETILNINARLADAVGRLSDRPQRPASGVVPANPSTVGSATGAGLYREDGRFLAGEAAAAATIAAERDACYSQYNELRAPVGR